MTSTGIGHRHLDARSLDMAKIIVRRIDEDPTLIRIAHEYPENEERRRGRLCQASKEWKEILTRPWSEVRELLLDESDEGQRLRSSKPFAGIVTEEARLAIIARHPPPWPHVPYDPREIPDEVITRILEEDPRGAHASPCLSLTRLAAGKGPLRFRVRQSTRNARALGLEEHSESHEVPLDRRGRVAKTALVQSARTATTLLIPPRRTAPLLLAPGEARSRTFRLPFMKRYCRTTAGTALRDNPRHGGTMEFEKWSPDTLPDFEFEPVPCAYCGRVPDLELEASDWLSASMSLPNSPNGYLDSWRGACCPDCRDGLEATIAELTEFGWRPESPVLLGEHIAPCSPQERERVDTLVCEALARDPLLARRVQPWPRPGGRLVVVVDDAVRTRMRRLLDQVGLDERWHPHVPYLRGRGRVEVPVPAPRTGHVPAHWRCT